MNAPQTSDKPSILDGNANDIIAALPDAEDLQALKDAETAGKARSTVLKAIDAEITKRQQPPKTSDKPSKIVLTCQFGYYDDAEQLRMWQAGQEITDADEIADLIERGAEHTIPAE